MKSILIKDTTREERIRIVHHIQANLAVFDFCLTEEEVSLLTYMPQTTWLGEHPDFVIPTARSNPKNV